MSEFFGDENEQQNSTESPGVKSLREALEKQAKELAALRADARKRQVEDLVPAGYNRQIATLYQGDPDKFGDWFEANKGIFSPQAPTGATQVQEQPEAVQEQQAVDPAVPAEVAAAFERMHQGETGVSTDVSKLAGEMEKANGVFQKHGGNIDAAIAELTGGQGPQFGY